MKITINGSAKELTELAIALSCMENEAKKPCLPPLLTELAESNSIGKNGKEKSSERLFIDFAPKFQAALERFCGDKKVDEPTVAVQNADKENAPQVEAAEQKKNQEIFEKQMELLFKASEFCVADVQLTQHLSALTHAMIELNPFCNWD